MPLVGCGFAPVYGSPRGTSGAATGIEAGLSQVRVEVIAGRSGQILRNLLIDRLSPKGLASDIRWRLKVTLEERQEAASIGRDAAATRGTLTLTAVMRLDQMSDGAEVLRGTDTAISDYNVLDDPFANDAVLRDARQGALEELRDDITMWLFAFLGQVSRS
jgi:LPS-assembly lipoprotein